MAARKSNPFLILGGVLIAAFLALAVFGALFSPQDPNAMQAGEKLLAPSLTHLFGTDRFGRDIFSRALAGLGTTFFVAAATVAIGAVFGTLTGALTGYYGGVADAALMRLNDTLTAFPAVLLALLAISLLGPGKESSLVLALGLVFIPGYARLMRTAFASLSNRAFVLSARLMGAKGARIIFVHLLPNTLPTLLPALTIGFNNAVLAEAGMSFLGIGVTPPDASLGYMLSEAQGMLAAAPWYAACVGGVIVLLVFAVGLFGEGLQRRMHT